MQHEGVVVSVTIAAMTLMIMFSVASWSTGEKVQAVGETVIGQISKPVGAVLTARDVAQVVGAHGCNAHLMDLAMDAVRQGRYSDALELDSLRRGCFRS